jgi:hypothetical protein
MHEYRAATYRPQAPERASRRRAAALFAFDTRAVNLLLLAAAIAAFVSYLALNNRASTKGFVIRGLERDISALETERQKLELAVVAAHSMDTIGAGITGLGLVPVAKIDYVSAPGGAVAVR